MTMESMWMNGEGWRIRLLLMEGEGWWIRLPPSRNSCSNIAGGCNSSSSINIAGGVNINIIIIIIINIIGGDINHSGGSDGGHDGAMLIVSCFSSGMAKGSSLGGMMVLYGGLGGHKTRALSPNSIAHIGAHGREAAARLIVGGKIVGGHGVDAMEEPGTDMDGLGGAVVPNEYGAGVVGSEYRR